MVPIVEGGDAEFSVLAHAMPHQRTVQYLETRLMEKMSSFGDQLSEWGRSFMQNSMQALDAFHGADAVRLANAAIRKAGTYFESNTIRPLATLEALQTAPPVMHRFLVANPFMRTNFIDGRIDGFVSAGYMDMEPGMVGPGHYDYDLVMDGVLQDDPENDFKISWNFAIPKEGDVLLTGEQKDTVITCWELMEGYFKHARRDGTDIFDTQV